MEPVESSGRERKMTGPEPLELVQGRTLDALREPHERRRRLVDVVDGHQSYDDRRAYDLGELTEIIDRRAVVIVKCLRVKRPHLEREIITFSKNTPRNG